MPTSTVPPIAAQARAQGHPAAQAAPVAPTSATAAVDPLRLLMVYWPWLLGAFIFSIFVGIGVYLALGTLAPKYKTDVLYEVLPPADTENVNVSVGYGGREEMTGYMETQVSVIESDRILDRAVKQPDVAGTQWAKKFTSGGKFVPADALKVLRNIVHARVVPDTNLIQFSVTTGQPVDAQIIANAVDEVFRRDNLQVSTRDATSLIDDLERKVREQRQDVAALDIRIENIINENQLSSADEKSSIYQVEIQNLQPALVDLKAGIASTRKQLERFQQIASSESGTVYPETIRQEVEQGSIPQQLQSQIQSEEAYLRSDRETYGAQHRTVIRRERHIRALREQRERVIQEEMKNKFNAALEGLEQQLASLQSQEADLIERREGAQKSLNEITRVLAEKENLEVERGQKMESIQTFQNIISDLGLKIERGSRVRVLSPPQIPDQRAFPQPIPVMGACIVLISGAAGGLIFLKEVREQRVRTPLDITQIPRTRVLGLIPETGLDPSNPVRVETASIDRPSGAVAEAVRQIRTTLLKTVRQHGHKSVVFVSGLPGSGTTSVVCNLAANAAAIDLRVLIIDANLRRPSTHRIFEVNEGPGLADVLKGKATLEGAIQKTSVDNVSVLSAGTDREHAYERFNTSVMGELLRVAGESFDLLLIDAPPAVVSGDALALTAQADAVAMVVRAYSEKRGLVARIRNQLSESRAEFLGVVVNAVRSSAGGYFKRNFQATLAYQQNGGENGTANGQISRDLPAPVPAPTTEKGE